MPKKLLLFSAIFLLFIFSACDTNQPVKITKKEIVSTPEQMQEMLPGLIHEAITASAQNNGIYDSVIRFSQPTMLDSIYAALKYAPQWSRQEKFTIAADSMVSFIRDSKLYGLFPEDYHLLQLDSIIHRIGADSLIRRDAVSWTKADLMLTDAFVHVIHDIKLGRLQKDSLTLRSDSTISAGFYNESLKVMQSSFSMTSIVQPLEPTAPGYQVLKAGISSFLDSASFRNYTYVPSPSEDSAGFKLALQKRLVEDSFLVSDSAVVDSITLAAAVKKYQARIKLKADGKAGAETIRNLNLNDHDKFLRIAISLDKYKMLPAQLPVKYIWVNLPAYSLQLWDNDTVRITSKVVVGKPLTRTPELNSSIYEMITYPQWTIPTSIIVKEVLPGLKKSPAYLEKKGYSLLDKKNVEVDPFFVDWSKYKTGIPYKVVQGSGDANALGIMKFNFPNKYAVYLHDTNQRYLFAQTTRALSHGCVRVQEWEKLTHYFLDNDSLNARNASFTKTDSVFTWLQRKEKHSVPVRNRVALFIRYFTCEGKDGRIVFYDDIYHEDHWLQEKYFAGK
jgi:murein L,D-transpeptidase YcbB/YkuD